MEEGIPTEAQNEQQVSQNPETTTPEPTQTTIADGQAAATTAAQKAKLPTDELIFGALSYFTIAVLATIVSKGKSEFCQFHAKQGVILVALDILFLVFTTVALAIVPMLSYLIFFVGMIALFVLHTLGIVNAIQGKKFKLPVVYALSKKVYLNKFLANTPKAPGPTQPTTPPGTPVAATEPPTQPINPTPTPAPTQPTPQPTTPAATSPFQNAGQDMVDRAVENLKDDQPNQNI